MKKFLKVIMAVLLIFTLCLSFAGCKEEAKETPETIAGTKDIYKIYSQYVTQKGNTPMSYDDWLESIKGEKGDKGDKGDAGTGVVEAYVNAEYELILKLSDGSEINCGKVIATENKDLKSAIKNIQECQEYLRNFVTKLDGIAESEYGYYFYIDDEELNKFLIKEMSSISKFLDKHDEAINISKDFSTHQLSTFIANAEEKYVSLYDVFVDAVEYDFRTFKECFESADANLTVALQSLLLELV